LEARVDEDEGEDEDGMTALHTAAAHGHLHVGQYQCEQGADKEARGKREHHWASSLITSAFKTHFQTFNTF